MREPKSFFLLVGMLVLVTISFVLISIWAYHSYFQDQHSTPIAVQSEQAPAPLVKNNNKDSLELILDSILRNSTNQQDSIIDNHSDSLDKVLGLKIVEFKKIKSDIIEILNKKTASKNYADADKINLLQQNVNELRERNSELESENERLKELVKELTASKNQKGETANENKGIQKTQRKGVHSLPLLVLHLKFTAIHADGGNKKITTLASQTNELAGSFELNIKSTRSNSSKIFIVILQPNGKVLSNPGGKSGMFYTLEGDRKYSVALHMDVLKDNHKRLQFSIKTPSAQKGKYTMQIYHGGILIGRLNKILL